MNRRIERLPGQATYHYTTSTVSYIPSIRWAAQDRSRGRQHKSTDQKNQGAMGVCVRCLQCLRLSTTQPLSQCRNASVRRPRRGSAPTAVEAARLAQPIQPRTGLALEQPFHLWHSSSSSSMVVGTGRRRTGAWFAKGPPANEHRLGQAGGGRERGL